eukprot:gene6234-7468_t
MSIVNTPSDAQAYAPVCNHACCCQARRDNDGRYVVNGYQRVRAKIPAELVPFLRNHRVQTPSGDKSAGYVLTDAYGVKADELQVINRGLTFEDGAVLLTTLTRSTRHLIFGYTGVYVLEKLNGPGWTAAQRNDRCQRCLRARARRNGLTNFDVRLATERLLRWQDMFDFGITGSKRSSTEQPAKPYARDSKIAKGSAEDETSLAYQSFHDEFSKERWKFTPRKPCTETICHVSQSNQTFYGIVIGHALQEGKLVVYNLLTRQMQCNIDQNEVLFFEDGPEVTTGQHSYLMTCLCIYKKYFTLNLVKTAHAHCKKFCKRFAWLVASQPFDEENLLQVNEISWPHFNLDTFDLVWCLMVTVPALNPRVYCYLAYSTYDNTDILSNAEADQERERVLKILNEVDENSKGFNAAKDIIGLFYETAVNRLRRCQLYFVFWHFHQAATAVCSVFQIFLESTAVDCKTMANIRDVRDKLQHYVKCHGVLMDLQQKHFLRYAPNWLNGIPKPGDRTYDWILQGPEEGEVVDMELLNKQIEQLPETFAKVVGYLWENPK